MRFIHLSPVELSYVPWSDHKAWRKIPGVVSLDPRRVVSVEQLFGCGYSTIKLAGQKTCHVSEARRVILDKIEAALSQQHARPQPGAAFDSAPVKAVAKAQKKGREKGK